MEALLLLLLIIIIASATSTSAQVPFADTGDGIASQNGFRPSVAIVVAVFAIMFFITFLLLLYVKFCHSGVHTLFNTNTLFAGGAPMDSQLRSSSGIDKTVIQSLPFFRFSALKGSRSGLECSVCLSRFDDNDLLRLLPKCKHAFHIDCIDHWLDSHSTCPLCRNRIDPHDATLFHVSTSTRALFNNDVDQEELHLDLYVERESTDHDHDNMSSSRSFRDDHDDEEENNERVDQDHQDEGSTSTARLLMHKFRHRIIVSDVLFQSRWSDLNSSDLVSLNSDMLGVMSGRRLLVNGGDDGGDERSMSDITTTKFVRLERAEEGEGRARKNSMWLPMARRTVQWFATGRRERRPPADANV